MHPKPTHITQLPSPTNVKGYRGGTDKHVGRGPAIIMMLGVSVGTWGQGVDSLRAWSLGFAVDHLQTRDALVKNLVVAGTVPGITVSHSHFRNGTLNYSSLSIGLGKLSDKYSSNTSTMRLRGDVLIGIPQYETSTRLMFGLLFSGTVNPYSYEDWDSNHQYWITAYSISPTITYKASGVHRILTVTLASATASLTSRPDFRFTLYEGSSLRDILRQSHSHLHFSGIDEYYTIEFKARLRHNNNKHRFQVGYDFRLAACRYPDPLTSITNGLVVSFIL